MFNLTVDRAHTFYVREKGWLVHNCGPRIDITADEIRAINKGLGGSTEMLTQAESALGAASQYDGFWDQTAAIVRSVAGGHMFNDANKRTTTAIVKTLMERHNIATGVSDVQIQKIVGQVTRGELKDVKQIAGAPRGFK